MNLEDVAGATYGPYQMRISPEKVAEFVAATGDEPGRWDQAAPPGFAGALLFVVAPHFLADSRVEPFTGILVHVDQTFTWHGPLTVGAPIVVTGRVDKVRQRGGRFFVTFSAAVDTPDGERLLDAVATFLMGRAEAPEAVDDLGEPPVRRRELNETPSVAPRPDIGQPFPPMEKSASRLDLVKYAAASGDYNPIHLDHDAARGAGLDGIVVHGLLMAAWVMQASAAISPRPDPIAHIKLRFRNALLPAVQSRVSGQVRDIAEDGTDARVTLAVTDDDQQLVTAQCVVRLEG
ncbi:MAG: MaoC/PaaZ C-terminal domain-containing protein [Actinomycetota bacterium]|nr:MaoC/PaaZ C-terminal domain-containing protein [Actinomycetota bacterium]